MKMKKYILTIAVVFLMISMTTPITSDYSQKINEDNLSAPLSTPPVNKIFNSKRYNN